MSELPKCIVCGSEMFHVVDDVYVCRDHRVYRVGGKFVGETGVSKVVGQDDAVGFNAHDMWIHTVDRARDFILYFAEDDPASDISQDAVRFLGEVEE